MATVGVDFFRVDRSGTTRRILVTAGGLICFGVPMIGSHLIHRFGESWAHFLALVGGMSVVGGLFLGFGGLAMFLFEDVYLLIKEEGLLVHDNKDETPVPWGDLEEISVDEDRPGFVVFRWKGGPPIRWFAGGGADHLKMRVDEAKRKAAHGLLKID